MTRTLLVGQRNGNIADEWAKRHSMGPNCNRNVFIPEPDVVNLLVPNQLGTYIATYGPFDEVVYCAGRNRLQWIPEVDRGDFVNTYLINVFGFLECAAKQIEIFGAGNAPRRMVAVVSDSSRTAMRGSVLYSSSKAALVGVIKNMARELAPRTVVVGVSPGIVEDTPMTQYIDDTVPGFRGWSPEQAKSYEESMIPMKRRVTKAEVAETIHFALTGPETLSGSIIEITGGK